MPLKRVKSIRFDLDLPELNQKIHYRNLKHGEQKNILLAFELKDEKAIVNSILDAVEACTFGELDTKKVPMHIVDFVFLKIYIASVGDKSPVLFTCGGTKIKELEDGTKEETPCGIKVNTFIDLNKAKLVYKDDYTARKEIKLTDDLTVILRIPSFESFKKFDTTKTWVEIADQFLWAGLEAIIEGDEIKVPGIDFTAEEMKEWMNDLNTDHMETISEFFDSLPELVLNHNITCPNCGKKEVFELHGLDAFFG